MNELTMISESVLRGDALITRSLLQDWLDRMPAFPDVPRPATSDPVVLAIAASIVELLAERSGQCPPPWAATIGPLPEPLFLLTAARTMPRLRAMCERESPIALRRRCLFAPSNYLTFV